MQDRLSNPAAVLALLLLATGLVYLAGLAGPFLLDDFGSVLPNRPQALDFEALFNAALANRPSLFRRPLANLSFGLNYLLAGSDGTPSPWGYKAVNLAIHLATVVVLFLLARALVRDDPDTRLQRRAAWVALCAAALWALHPLHVSTVLYTVQRMAQLAALFTLAAVIVYYRARSTHRSPASLVVHAAGVVVLVGLGLLSKESAAVAPLLFLVLELTVLRSRDDASAIVWRLAFIWIPVLLGLAGLAALWPGLEAGFEDRPFTMAQRLASQFPILAGYLQQLVFPLPHRMGLYLDGIQVTGLDPEFWFSAGLIALLLGAALAFRRRLPLLSLGVLWFFAAHALESSILPLELAFEHRNYLAAAGIAMGVGGMVAYLGPNGRWVALGLVALLGVQCALRVQDWKTREHFIEAQFSRHPESLRAALDKFSLVLPLGNAEQVSTIANATSDRYPVAGYLMLLLAECAESTARPAPPVLGRAETPKSLLIPLRAVVVETLNGRCDAATLPALRRLIGDLLQSPRLRWNDGTRLRLMQLRAWLEHEASPERAARAYELAAVLFPQEPDPLFQKAYLWLNAGRPEFARAEMRRLRAREDDYDTPIVSRLAELETQLLQLEESLRRGESAAKPPEPTSSELE